MKQKKYQSKQKKKQIQKKSKPRKKPVKKKKTGKKVFLISFLIFIIALGGGVFYLLTNLNAIVKAAIEKYGSMATQTAVRVSGVKISLKEGSGAIHNLTVANPKGFDTRHAFSLGEIGSKIDIKSITKDVKIIDDITILAPEIFVEVNKENKNNLNELKNNLTSGAPSTPSKKTTKKKSSKEPKLIIKHIRFADGQIHAKVAPLDNKEYELKLVSFEMWNLGGKTGATPAEIAKQVLTELTNRALREVKRKGISQGADKLKSKASSQLETEKEKALNKLLRK